MTAVSLGRGEVIPGIDLLEQLGRGAQTDVFRCRRDGCDYVVKIGRADMAGDDRASVRFRREAALLASVRHQALPRIYEVGKAGGRPYMIMDLVQGRTLSACLSDGPLSYERLVTLGVDVAGGLAEAHRWGLVHFDVKPDNIIIGDDGHATVIDFGLATHGGVEVQGTVAGTLYYSAPEQTGMLKRPVDRRSDLYSLGVVLFEAAAGVRPFASDDPGEVIRMHAVHAPPDLREIRPDLPLGLIAIVAKLLAKDPDDRYQNGECLVSDLIVAGRDISTLRAEPPRQPAGAGGESLPFVGRSEEIETLRQAWQRARGGRVEAVSVEGHTGVGKSRLVSELLDRIARDNPLVLWARCATGTSIPYAVFRSALGGHLAEMVALDKESRRAATSRLVVAAGPYAPIIGSLSPTLAQALGVDLHLGSEQVTDQFVVTFSLFLVELARLAGGLVLWVDDAQWADDGSRQLLDHLAGGTDQGPLLVIRCSQTGEPSQNAGRSGAALTGARSSEDTTRSTGIGRADGSRWTSLVVEPLTEDLTAELVRARIHGAVDPEFANMVAARCGGIPLALLEYLSAVIEAGVMRPSWGQWKVDRDALAQLELPAGVTDLLLRRIDHLGPAERGLLTVAAAAGSLFDVDLVRRLCVRRGIVSDPTSFDQGIARAVDVSLIERRPDGRAAFVHDRVAHQLLSTLDPNTQQVLHQQLAEAADNGELAEQDLFTVAHHYRLGRPADRPARMVEICRQAGQAALDMHAPGDALTLLSAAHQAAASHGIAIDAAFEGQLAAALLRGGQSEAAIDHFERAVTLSADPWQRAAFRAQLGRINFTEGRYDHGDAHVVAALREVGRPMPRRSGVALVVCLVRGALATVTLRLRLGVGTARGERRSHDAVLAALYEIGAQIRYMRRDPAGTVAFHLAALRPANRLGMSPEYLRVHAALCQLTAICHRRRTARRSLPRLQQQARELGDPSVLATLAVSAVVTAELLGETNRAAELARSALTELGRWMEPGEYQMVTLLLAINLGIRGHHRQMTWWLDRYYASQQVRVGDGREEQLAAFRGVNHLVTGRSYPETPPLGHYLEEAGRITDPGTRLNLLDILTLWTIELGVDDGTFDDVVARRDAEHVPMATATIFDRFYWCFKASGRLAQWRIAVAAGNSDEIAHRRTLARFAVRQARQASRGTGQPYLHAMVLLARAGQARLDRHPKRAARLLARAEKIAVDLDAPAVRIDIWCERARAMFDRGQRAQAEAEIGLALSVVSAQGMERRARAIRTEFPGAAPSERSTTTGERSLVRSIAARSVARSTSIGSDTTSTSLAGRRLEALLQVSVAAASIIDPRQLARIALDEALVILGAERALLFLADAGDTVSFFAGRDSEGTDLPDAVRFSSTAVERAWVDREALVVTGSDEGALIGSKSAVVHGLRSILVAPLQLEGRLIGVVYLDSRLAKGMFTATDVDVLVAIATQVAVCFETARTAQLEMLVHTEREQRALVETLRDVMADMTTTFEPGEVLNRLLAGLGRSVAYDAAWVVVLDPDRPRGGRLLAQAGATTGSDRRSAGSGSWPGDVATSPSIPRRPLQSTLQQVRAGIAVLDPTAESGPPGATCDFIPGSWLAVPLPLSEETQATLVVVSATPDAYGDTQLEIVRTVVAHGIVGYQNAWLFTANRRLAVTDELSGLANRRSFFETASARLASARHDSEPLSLLMVDIDHFKVVNDTAGHPTGDDVIREIADRLRSSARAQDIVGRYGGEEFSLLVAASSATALAVAERIRVAVAERPVLTRSGPIATTISVGITDLTASDQSIDDLLTRADAALYQAKAEGRNRVVHR